jgi:LPS-assembly protein
MTFSKLAVWQQLLFLIAFCFGFASWGASPSLTRLKTSSGGNIIIVADNIDRDLDAQTIDLHGNVQVIYELEHVSADHILMNLKTQTLTAEGRIIANSASMHLEADSMGMNYVTEVGVIHNGFVRSGQVYLEGETIERKGPTEYSASKAYFTACDTCPPAWSFTGRSIDAKMGSYAKIKHGWLEFGRVALIPIPYLLLPLQTDRHTGLLLPSVSREGAGGWTYTQSYFWAIDRSQDATFTFKNYEFRGQQGITRYRYMLGPISEGELNLAGLADRAYGRGTDLQGYRTSQSRFDRWNIDYSHFYEMPDGFTQYTKISDVSDLDYPRDFPDQVRFGRKTSTSVYGDPAIESRVYLAKATETSYASVDSSYYINLLKTDPIASNYDAIQKIPEIRYSLVNTKIPNTNALFHLDFDYANFTRNGPGYDNTCYNTSTSPTTRVICNGQPNTSPQTPAPTDPLFNAGQDLIRTGSRLSIKPELSYPFQIGSAIDAIPRVSFQHMQYNLNVSPYATDQSTPVANNAFGQDPNDTAAPSRDYLRTSISFRTRLSQIYIPDKEDPKANRYKHEIIPELGFSTVPYSRQTPGSSFLGNVDTTPPFLDSQPISDSDFKTVGGRGVQFDYYDRITNRQLISAGLTNKLVQRKWVGGEPVYNEIAKFKVTQSYDFEQLRQTPKYPWSDLAATLSLRLHYFETDTTSRYFQYQNKINTSSTMQFHDDRGDAIAAGVTQNFLISEDLNEAYPDRSENLSFGAKLVSKYFVFNGQIDYLPIRWDVPGTYKVKSWTAYPTFLPPGKCWGLRFMFRQDINTKLTYKLEFNYNFGSSQGGPSTLAPI